MSFKNTAMKMFFDSEEEQLEIERPHLVQSGHLDIVVRTPHSFADVREYADYLMDGRAIVISFEAVEPTLKDRIFDYLNGVAYIVDASISCVSKDILMYTPTGVAVDKQVVGKKSVRSWLG